MTDQETESGGTKRVIKRYSNRKLYDTRDSTYVTLLQIAELLRAGEDVQIIDNATKEDKTDLTLALIISEELKARPRGIPLATLKALIRQRGGRFLSHLKDGPIGRWMPSDSDGEFAPADAHREDEMAHKDAKGLRATLEQWQSTIDERIRTVLPNFSPFRELQQELLRLQDRVDQLEQEIASLRRRHGEKPDAP